VVCTDFADLKRVTELARRDVAATATFMVSHPGCIFTSALAGRGVYFEGRALGPRTDPTGYVTMHVQGQPTLLYTLEGALQ
jgi:hypothetical protein